MNIRAWFLPHDRDMLSRFIYRDNKIMVLKQKTCVQKHIFRDIDKNAVPFLPEEIFGFCFFPVIYDYQSGVLLRSIPEKTFKLTLAVIIGNVKRERMPSVCRDLVSGMAWNDIGMI